MSDIKRRSPAAATNGATIETQAEESLPVQYNPKTEPRVDSRVIAEQLGRRHRDVREQLIKYQSDFRELGVLPFQTDKPKTGGGRPERYAMLNENQAYILITYSRNTARARRLKLNLVKAFAKARNSQDAYRGQYLPAYHPLMDAIAAKGAKPRDYTNVNRMVNKAVGIESGQRGELDAQTLGKLTAAQMAACSAYMAAPDKQQAYQAAKAAVSTVVPLLEVGNG